MLKGVLVRRLVIVLVLAGTLTAMWWLRQQSLTWYPIVSSESGEIIFASTFDTSTDDWSIQERRGNLIQYNNGGLQLTANQLGIRLFSTTPFHFDDIDFSIQAAAVSGPENNSFGLIFRQQNENTYYTFTISSDSYYRVMRVLDGDETPLSDWILSPNVNIGVNGIKNDLRVVAVGGTFRFYLNGEQLQLCVPNSPDGISTFDNFNGECVEGTMRDTLTDSTIPSGGIGTVVEIIDQAGVDVLFDNVVVYAP